MLVGVLSIVLYSSVCIGVDVRESYLGWHDNIPDCILTELRAAYLVVMLLRFGPVVGPTPGGIPEAAPNKLKSFWIAASCIAFSFWTCGKA
jgi:hypothetical protein